MNHKPLRTLLLFAVLAVAPVLFAAPGVAAAKSGSYPVRGFDLEIGSGYRVDQFNWNKAGIPDSPPGTGVPVNVLSELTWTDLEIVEFSVLGRKTVDKIYLRGSFSFGFIHSGANRDSDYARDDRVFEYLRSENNGGDGTVWDVSLGAGYKGLVLTAGEGAFTFRPLIGLSAHKQNLTITDGYQTVDFFNEVPYVIPGLDSTYRALWFGPWAGFEADYATGALALYATAEVHGAAYRAEANWNLRSDWQHPVSYEQFANAVGVVLSIGAEYGVTEALAVVASFKHQDWQTFSGTDRIYHASGAVSDNRLNGVNWMSDSFNIGFMLSY